MEERIAEHRQALDRIHASASNSRLVQDRSLDIVEEADVNQLYREICSLADELEASSSKLRSYLRDSDEAPGMRLQRKGPSERGISDIGRCREGLHMASDELIILKKLISGCCDHMNWQGENINAAHLRIRKLLHQADQFETVKATLESEVQRERERADLLSEKLAHVEDNLSKATSASKVSKSHLEDEGDDRFMIESGQIIQELKLERAESNATVDFLTGKLEESARVL
jgi:hypothetical protein